VANIFFDHCCLSCVARCVDQRAIEGSLPQLNTIPEAATLLLPPLAIAREDIVPEITPSRYRTEV
jgi:hypothetical protein